MVARLTGGQEVVGSNPVIPTMYTYLTSLGIFTAILILCIVQAGRSKKPIAKVTRQLMVSVLFPIASNILIAFSETPLLSEIGYMSYFVSTDWMLIYTIRYVAEYCDYPYYKTGLERVMGLLAGIDTVSIFLNHAFHHCFSLEKIVLENGHIYYKYGSLWYHYIHLAFSYIVVLACVIMLVTKLFKTSIFYREKYVVIIGSIMAVGVWELYYIIYPSVLEYSMLAYAAMPILVYFFTIIYKPFFATHRMLNEVVSNVSEAILFFDDNHKCIYTNRQAKELFGFEDVPGIDAWKQLAEDIAIDEFELQDILKEGYYQKILDYYRDGEKLTFDIEYQRVMDKKGRVAGEFLTARDRTEEQRRLDKERYQATHDSLTGLYNAEYLYTRIEKELIENSNHRYVIVVSDIKGFKMVNDVYGQKTGDDILINIARELEKHASDSTIYGRISGDKFGLMMRRENYTETIFTDEVKRVTQDRGDMYYPIIVHVGVYEITDRRIPVSVMFDRAFMALSTVKNDLQKRIAYYDSNLREDVLWEQRIAGSIDAGLESEQIIPYMQPQVSGDGTIRGVELLARWMHPTEGFLKPKRFLPTLEKNGYVVRLDQFMWERACRTIKKWESTEWSDLYVSVNISPVDFFFMDVVSVLVSLVERYEIEPKKLRLEITENTMMYDAKRRIEVIDNLREHGFLVEMDDFGNGFSSLNMLKDIPIDVIKIDMAFLEEGRDEEKAKEILQSMISLANRLSIPVITEGVETKEQLDFLTAMGCDSFQGYYFARAVPSEDFEERYLRTGKGRIVREG